MLTDGHTLYTPGLSENRGGASRYYSNDLLGNLWTLDASSKSQLSYQDTTGFGTTLGSSGSGSPFGYGGGNGCQTDADTGLILMGHRYYDTRIGRFITQDHAKSGGNWYAYAGNNPTNKTDPLGLTPEDGPGSSATGSPGYSGTDGGGNGYGGDDYESYENNQQVDQNIADQATMLLNALAQVAQIQQAEAQSDWVFNLVGPSASISLGPIHFDGSLGIAVQGPGLGATGWGVQLFGAANAGIGIGLGLSVSTGKIANLGSIGFGVGNLNGFDGGSWFGSILAQPITSLTYSQSLTGGYKGLQVGLPYGGIDVGLYGGLGCTVPILSAGHKN